MGSGPPAGAQGKGLFVERPSLVGGRSAVVASPAAQATSRIAGRASDFAVDVRPGSLGARGEKKWGAPRWAARVARVLI